MATADGAVLLVAADRRELAGLLVRCGNREPFAAGLPFAVRARLGGQRVVLAANGPGPRLAAEAVRKLAAIEPLRAVVSTGSCGALDEALEPGAIFVATEVRCVATGACFPTSAPPTAASHRRGRLLSLDRVIVSAAEKAALRPTGEAVEMEAAGVAREAQARGLPFYAVRVVLDGAQESFRLDYNALRDPHGRFSAKRLLWAALTRPHGAAELIELRRRLRDHAEILGEFLAGCEF